MRKICLRAFVKGNLGDDLLIHLLCSRYPNDIFYLCGEKKYKNKYMKLSNLKYISVDTFFALWGCRILNIFCYILCKIKGIGFHNVKTRVFDYFSRKADLNIYIIGSGFIERYNDICRNKYAYIKEKKYYKRNTYVIDCSFGPYSSMEYVNIYKDLFSHTKQVSFRDINSYTHFTGDNILIYPDVVFSIKRFLTLNRNIGPVNKPYILIAPLDPDKDLKPLNNKELTLNSNYIHVMRQIIRKVVSLDFDIVIMCLCKDQGDDSVADIICQGLDLIKDRIKIVSYSDTYCWDMIDYFINAGCVITSRFHAMVLGWVYNKSVLSISFSEKINSVASDCGAKDSIMTLDECLDQTYLENMIKKLLSNMFICPDTERISKEAEGHFAKLDLLYGQVE